MTETTTRPHPSMAVAEWWQSMQDRDTSALAAITLRDYISSGGPGPRAVGQDQLLREAADFFASATIDDWSVDDMEVREHGDVAICAYRWSERGQFNNAAFQLSGLATDVLVFTSGRWQHQAHHVSNA